MSLVMEGDRREIQEALLLSEAAVSGLVKQDLNSLPGTGAAAWIKPGILATRPARATLSVSGNVSRRPAVTAWPGAP